MWQLWDRRIWSLVTHDTTWREHLLTLCPCAIWGRGKQHGCLFRLAMHFLSSVVLSLEFSECLGAGSRRSLRYHFHIRVPHQDKWRKTWHVWDPINHGIKKTIYQRVQDSSHQQCALLSLISHSSCRMLTAPFARAKLLQGRFLAMTLEILCCSQSHLGLQEVQKPQTYCQKARLLHSFVPQVPVFFSESCRAELKLLFNRDIKSEEKAGFQGEVLFIPAKIPMWFLLLWILGVVTTLWFQELFEAQTWQIWGQPGESAKPKWWGGERGCGNRTGTLCLPAQLIYCDSGVKKCWVVVSTLHGKSWKKKTSISCWWYRPIFHTKISKSMDPVNFFSPVKMWKLDRSVPGISNWWSFWRQPAVIVDLFTVLRWTQLTPWNSLQSAEGHLPTCWANNRGPIGWRSF